MYSPLVEMMALNEWGMESTFNEIVILFVDDEPIVRAALLDTLRSENYVVIEASTYEEAMDQFERRQRKRIDLLISDVAMPGRDGCELAKELLMLQPDLKVLFISGHTGAETCRRYGIQVTDLHFLQKPFLPKEILRRVKEVLASEAGCPNLFRSFGSD